MQLAPVAAGVPVNLHSDSPSDRPIAVTIGRAHYSSNETRISRQHAQVTAHSGTVTIHAHRPVHIQKASGQVTELPQGRSCELHEGDVLFLLKAGSSYVAGFRLQQSSLTAKAAQETELATSKAENEPPAKRHKGAALLPPAQDDKAAQAVESPESSAAHTLPHVGPFSAAVAAAAQEGCLQDTPAARARGAKQLRSPQQPPTAATGQVMGKLLEGVRLVDWDGHHTQLALKRAAEEGAAVSQVLDETTTHVISRFGLSAPEVLRKLSAQSSKQRQHHRQSWALKRQSPESKVAPQRQQQQQQQQAQQGEALQLASSGSLSDSQQQQQQQQQSGGQEHVSQLLPPGVHFVTVSWITQSLKSKQKLPEEQFYTNLQQLLQRSPSGAHARVPPPGAPAAQPAAAPTPVASAPAAAAAAAARPGTMTVECAPASQEQQQQQAHSQEKGRSQVPKQQVLVPGPDELCPAGTAWGSDNRWIEPWDEAAALDAMEQLMAHWHQTTGKHSRAAAAAVGTPASTKTFFSGLRSTDGRQSYGDGEQLLPFQQHQPVEGDQGSGTAACAAPCEHVACCKQSFCLVEEMERLKRNYHGRADQFRIKAASRAILELERLQKPITGSQDIEVMAIGEKSKQKLQEILQTGRLRRNDLLEGSELHRCLQLFMTVWGCADNTARKWWSEGCRTLDDVRAKASGLTAIQQMGLRYYDDFEQRIPRAEVAEAVSIIRETTLDVLERLTGKSRETLAHLLHVRALGSFVRGKLDTGDIDMLLAPGPAAEDISPGPLAAGLLKALQDKGYVTEGLSLDHRGHSLETAVRVSWMGVWKGPSSPCHRRLDIKTYERAALPYAVCYFSSGQDCSRALRYWCNKPQPRVAALAAAIHPSANAFHLSDTGLYVVHNPKLPPATAPAQQLHDNRSPAAAPAGHQQASETAAAAAAAAGAGAGGGGSSVDKQPEVANAAVSRSHASLSGDGDGIDDGMDAVLGAGIPVVTPDSHGPNGPAGRVECSNETDIFQAVGLAYVPPHLRNWH